MFSRIKSLTVTVQACSDLQPDHETVIGNDVPGLSNEVPIDGSATLEVAYL